MDSPQQKTATSLDTHSAPRKPLRAGAVGHVSLVGAGPGDPDLLTLRAVARLAAADLVLYDALVDRAALRHAPHARWAYVGKRAGRLSIAQETIERVMIRRARRGERVVRLKSGDPFVFGRGGEEALALAAAGVPCEIVPGVSSAVAGPALAGIPVTHRGLAAAFVVVSGHAPSAYAPVLSSLKPGAATVVVLMGLGARAAIAKLLLAQGWPASTPAALVLSAGHAAQRDWRGALSGLAACALPLAQPESPGILVIGATVDVAAQVEALRAQALARENAAALDDKRQEHEDREAPSFRLQASSFQLAPTSLQLAPSSFQRIAAQASGPRHTGE